MSSKKIERKIRISKPVFALGFFIAGFASCFHLIQNDYPTFQQTPPIASTNTSHKSLSVCFTPNGACLPKVIKAISNASSSILILGYSFTSQPITKALIAAKNRGLKIRIVLDHSQRAQKSSKEAIQSLITAGIDLKFDHSVKIAHNKVMIIDNAKVLTGSYNWTHSAEYKNAENIIFIESDPIVKKYVEYFESRWLTARTK